MGLYTDKSVEIEVTDNGWVLTWSDDKKRWEEHALTRVKQKHCGREIFTDKKTLINRVKQLI